jgi:ABC-type lipoprotein release transport system permease subunit
MFIGFFQRASAMPQIQLFNDWFARIQRDPAEAWWKQVAGAVDLSPLNQIRAPLSYLGAPMPVASELSQAWGTPGLSMITLDDLRLRRDTPNDTLANLNLPAVLPQLAGVRELFFHAWNDPKFRGPAELKRVDVSFTGQVVSAAPGKPVPDLPRDGFLATYYYISNTAKDKKIPSLAAMPWTMGMRRNEVVDTDAEGNYRFEGLPKVRADQLLGNTRSQNDMQTFAVNVYRIDPASGAITATTDLGKQAGDIRWSADIKEKVLPIRSLAFNCEEFALTGLYDPRFLQTLGEVLPLDARRNAEPQRYDIWMDDQMMAGFVEPGMPMDLLIRYGRVGNRVILINGADGRGFTPRELNNLDPLALATSRDFYQLDDRRLSDYRRAGVSSALIDRLHHDAGEQLQAAEASFKSNDDVGLLRNATGAWANEARVYDAAQAMAHDVVRAAIFLLILCIPFSFCMERLLIGTASVYKQIAGVAIIFLIMSAALWAFHPAFKISASPLIIILAFAIIAMSLLVIFVIYGKFDTELKRLLSGRGSAHGTSIASAGVMMSAVLLGIANMRKRKFRTLLTSITIVLITFAVLCFTSTTRFVGTQTLPTGVAASYPGVLLRERGFRSIEPVLPDQLRAVLADPALKLSKTPEIVEQWWAVSVNDPKEQYNLSAGVLPPLAAGEGRGEGTLNTAAASNSHTPSPQPSPAGRGGDAQTAQRVVSIPGVLGLSPGEGNLSRISQIIGEKQFARLENGEQHIIYLSDATAKDLAVHEGDTVRLGGIDLQVAGIYNADAFDQKVLTLSGDPLSPLKYTTGLLDAGGQKMTETGADTTDLAGSSSAAEIGTVYEHLVGSQFVIVPADLCKQLFNSSLRSVAFRLDDEQQVKRVSEELTRRFALAMYAGYDDGVRMVSAANLSSISGASQVAIPLVLAGLIIFNTMMGSIAERRREIHVYTSLGLAPMHVGALFVAEAMTYGLVGTIFGYIIGQGAGTMLQKLGWLGGATLNYSGTSAMLTIGLILVIVFLSALVPARLASKIAAPSIDRTWKVPTPKDDEITAILPFTINRTAADGALAYLAEFFDEHREGTIGKFSADRVEPIPSGLKTTVWLTPYDLGIRQTLTLLIHPGEYQDIYEVKVQLHRLSGDDGSWHRMNKTFLTELRKQFLQWRSLPPARMMEYVQESRRLFATG